MKPKQNFYLYVSSSCLPSTRSPKISPLLKPTRRSLQKWTTCKHTNVTLSATLCTSTPYHKANISNSWSLCIESIPNDQIGVLILEIIWKTCLNLGLDINLLKWSMAQSMRSTQHTHHNPITNLVYLNIKFQQNKKLTKS